MIVLNLGSTAKTLDLTQHFSLGAEAEVITSSLQSRYINGETVKTSEFVADANVGTVLVALN